MTSQSLLDQAALCLQKGDLWHAEFLYRQVIQHAPFRFEPYVPLAMILIQRGQTQEAAKTLEQALRLKPDDATALFHYGNVLYASQRPHDALASYDKALAISPNFLDALNNRAVVLCALDRFEEALTDLDRVLARNPANMLAHHNRGIALAGLERFSEALKAYDTAIALVPGHADAWNNRAAALTKLQRISEAVESYDKALSLNPRSADALYNRGVALTELKRIEEALQSYKRCVALAPNDAKATYNLSLCLLQLGRLEEGFRLYESRKHLPDPIGLHRYPQPYWSGGEDIRGKTVLVHAEQGAGDIIQFSRYLALLRDKGANIILAVSGKLTRLLKSLPVEIVSANGPGPDFDYHVSLMSLPFLFRTTLDNIPAGIPYLAAEPELVGKWRDRIGDAGFKIGIVWQSSASGARIGKSFPLSQYAGLSKIPGVRLISLQRHDETGPMNDFPLEQFGAEFDGGADAFIDSAAVMQCLDLVITSDTAIAHLAGALGRPVWLALKYVPDWRWLLDRADTPWYPTMRLFRQPAAEDWDGLFVQMQSELAAVMAGRPENLVKLGCKE